MGSYETKIFINDSSKGIIKIKGSTNLNELRKQIKIPNDDKYYFISKNNSIIHNESNFEASDVIKKSGDDYKIDIKSIDCFENKSYIVMVYINNKNTKEIQVKYNKSLKEVRDSIKDIIPKNDMEYYFISKDNSLINKEDEGNRVFKNLIKDSTTNRIDLKTRKFFENKPFEVNVYINDVYRNIIKIKYDSTLKEIKEKCKGLFMNEEKYYFVVGKKDEEKIWIQNEDNFIMKDILKDDETRIDLQTIEFIEKKPILYEVIINENINLTIPIDYEHNKLKDIIEETKKRINLKNKELEFCIQNNESIISSDDINNFQIKDIIKIENNKKIIYVVEKQFYYRMKIIKILSELKKKAENEEQINWNEQFELIKLISELAGVEIENQIKKDFGNEKNDETPGNNTNNGNRDGTPENNKNNKGDLQYIEGYLKLLYKDKSESNNNYGSAPLSPS